MNDSRKNSANSVVSHQEIQKQTGDNNSRIIAPSLLEADSTVDKKDKSPTISADANCLTLQ